ncbi:uracil phosphoribosyltransferase [Gregarina niphandrodes]|uniref:uracil phosphoribosyltransferase n=1 Tax=Gregarina niphandrodes TaxID=110365 RepID=A0A023B321_GRENI|nr:uracil phosphoribosyltransferase [Gregarina niphandrodes]EZG55331.1 uracil phosphoribosyltransferase [Gregarina niphandrodes]|eukprot:XP_011131626.1 uracil phosphoribosyltransferase [Gregarina niphandrodes]
MPSWDVTDVTDNQANHAATAGSLKKPRIAPSAGDENGSFVEQVVAKVGTVGENGSAEEVCGYQAALREMAERVSELQRRFPRWVCAPMTPQRMAISTIMRDKRTSKSEFVFYADRLIRLIIEDALNELPYLSRQVDTPVAGQVYDGIGFSVKICGVSIVRAGESMEAALREVCRGCVIGKILIQRDEETLEPKLLYHKLPADVRKRHVLLMDPMLGTGGSAIRACEVLVNEYAVPPNKIIFCNLVCAPEGLANLFHRFPDIRVVTAICDRALDRATGFIVPGFGDFGDRYFGTISSHH